MIQGAPAIMITIAECESGTRQFTASGKVIRDSVYGTHVGLYQIAESWIPTATKRGDNIYTAPGNISFALYLYKKYGTQPWNASKNCWGGTDV